MAHYAKLTQEKKDKFCALIRETGNASKAAQSIGVSRITAYDHKGKDAEFNTKWLDAREEWIDNLEEEGGNRAYGADKIIFDQDGQEITAYDAAGNVMNIKGKPSDILLMFYMKANRDKYKDRHILESDAKNPLSIDVSFVQPNDSKNDKS